MGVRVDSRPLIIGLEDLPHLLVAGTTGSGKSVFVNSCIAGLCYCRKPEELRLLMIDPKRVELSIYEHLPHMLAKPVTSPKKAIQALAWAVREMEQRYDIFAKARVRNLAGYNEKAIPKDRLPHIVIIVDELADLMFTAQKDVEDYICRLAQMARATGIHLLLATQRPSVNVVTGLIKANIPARVAFTLPSQADSRTIIDVSGAEKLLGKGDMLFVSPRFPKPVRLQSPYIEDGKSLEFINYMKALFGKPEYIDIEEQGGSSGDGSGADSPFTDDPLLEEAMQIILDSGIASASRLQRQLRIGFTRAARLIDTMEQLGIVGPPEGSKPREILVDDQRALEILDEHI
jgi:S-DNA-T family DNA segregation ATPase FtsK/SpoIIIE